MIELTRKELETIYDILADYVDTFDYEGVDSMLKEQYPGFDEIVIVGAPDIETAKSAIAKVAECLYSAPQ